MAETESRNSKPPPIKGFPVGLTFVNGKGVVSIAGHRQAAATLDLLEMEIPNLRFPFDLSGGASSFRHRRCELLRAQISLEERRARRWIARRVEQAAYGFRDLRLTIQEGTLTVRGQTVLGERQADFIFSGFARASGQRGLQICLCDLRLYGPFPVAAPLLAAGLLQAAAGLPATDDILSTAPWVERSGGCCEITVDPLGALLHGALPGHGWRIPSTKSVHLISVDLKPGEVKLCWGEPPDPVAPQPPSPARLARLLTIQEAKERFLTADRALLETSPDDALASYRELHKRHPDSRFVIDRLLQLLVSNERHDDLTRRLAEEARALDPDGIQAHLAEAAIYLRAGQHQHAGECYSTAADLLDGESDATERLMALGAAGRCFLSSDHRRARRCYEQILELDDANEIAMAQLAPLYAEAGSWSRLVVIRERQLPLADNPEMRVHGHLALGELFRVHLGQMDRALAHFNDALEIDPRCEPALRGLAEAHIDGDRILDAVRVLDRLCGIINDRRDVDAEVTLHLRIASLWEHLGDREAALDRIRRALDRQPENPQALEIGGKLLIEVGRLEQAAALLERQRRATSQPSAQVEILIKQADLALRRSMRDEASLHLEQALAIDPGHRTALQLLVQLSRMTEDVGALADALRRAAAAEPAPAHRASLLLERGRLLANDEGEKDQAIDALQLAAQLDPEESWGPLEAIARIYQQNQQWPLARPAWERALKTDKGMGSAEGHLALARVLQRQEDHHQCRMVLQKAHSLAEGDRLLRREILGLLVDTCRALKDAPQLQRAISELIPLLDPATSSRLPTLLIELGDAKHKTGDLEGSMAHYIAAAELRPDDIDLQETIGRLRVQRCSWESARENLEQVYQALPPEPALAPRRAALSLELAAIAENQDRISDAIELYSRSLAEGLEEEEGQRTWDHIIDLHLERNDPQGAVHALREASNATASLERQANRLFLAGQILLKRLAMPEDACSCFREALERWPRHPGVLDALESLLRQRGDREELVEVLQKKVEISAKNPEVQKQVLIRLGEALAALQRRPEAHTAFTGALALDDHCFPALLYLARETVQAGNLNRAAPYLNRLKQLLSQQRVDDQPKQHAAYHVEIHLQLAHLARHSDQPQEEEGHLEQILSVEPDHDEALARLDQLLTAQERLGELIDIIQRRIKASQDPEVNLAMEVRLGGVLERIPSRKEEASAHYRSVLNRSHDHLPALEALAAHLREQPPDEELLDVLERLAAARGDSDPRAAAALWGEAAHLAETKLANPTRAITNLRHALHLEPDHRPYFDKLVELLDGEGQSQEVENLLSHRSSLEQDPERRCTLALRLADKLLARGRGQDALRALRDAVADGPSPPALLSRQAQIHEQQDDWPLAAESYLQLTQLAAERGDTAMEIKAATRLIHIYREILDDPARAEKICNRLLELDPENSHALELLSEVLQMREQWPELIALLQRRLDLLRAAPDRSLDEEFRLLSQSALALDRSDRRPEAEGPLRDALELARQDLKLYWPLAGIARDMELSDVEIRCLDHLANASPEDFEVHLRLAHLQLEADQKPAALEAFQLAIQLMSPGPPRSAAVREVLRLVAPQEELEGPLPPAHKEIALSALQILIQEDITPGEQLQLAGILAEDQQNHPQALALLEDLPDAQTTDRARSLRLELLESMGQFRELAEEREVRARELTSPEERIDALLDVTRFWGEKTGDLQRCQRAALAALEVRPADETLITRLAELMEQLRAWDHFFAILRAHADPGGPCRPALQAETLCRSAATRRSLGRDAAEIEEDYCLALDRSPQCIEALDALIALYKEQAAPEKLVGVLLKRSECAAEIPAMVTSLIGTAELLSQHLNRPQAALPLLKRARELRPEDPRVLLAVADLYQLLGDLYQAEEALLTLSHLLEDPEQVLNRACGLARLRGDAPQEAQYLALLAHVKPVDSRVLLRLTSAFKSSGDMRGLCDVLEQLAVDSQQALSELAKLYAESLEDLPSAYDCYARLLKERPNSRENLQAMIEICGRLRKEPEAVGYLERLCHLEPPGLRRKELNIELARRSEEQGSLPRAEEAWQAALEESPRDPQLIIHLTENLRQQGGWQRLSVLLEDKLDCCEFPPEIRCTLASTLGEVYLDNLDDMTSGVYWLSIASESPGENDRAFRRLIAIYRQQQDFDRAAHLLSTRIEQLPKGSRSHLWQELGFLQEIHLKDPDAAARSYSAAYLEDPQSELKFAWRAHELQMQSGDLESALTLLERAITRSDDQDRSDLQVAHAQTMARRGLNSEAIDEYEQVLKRFPNHFLAHAELGKQLYGQGMFGAALPHLQTGSDHLQDPVDSAELSFLAGCALEKLGLSDEALSTYEQAANQNPSGVHILKVLIPYYESRRHWNRLAGTLTALIALTNDNEARAALMTKLGETHMKRGQKEAAYHCFLKSLSLDSNQVEVLAPLRLLAYERQDWKHCADLIVREIRITPNPLFRAALHRQLGVLLQERLDDAEGALEQFQLAIKLNDDDTETAAHLLPLLEQRARWGDAAHLRRKLAATANDRRDRKQHLIKAVDDLEQAGLSTEAQRLAREIDDDLDLLTPLPQQRPALLRVTEADTDEEDPYQIKELADEVLTEMLQNQDLDWITLAQSCRRRAAEAADPEIRARILLTAARAIDERLHQPLEALVLYGEAAAAAPDYSPAALALADAAYHNQDWYRAREIYDQLMRDESYQNRVDICYRRALVYETIGDDLTAADGYTKALAIDPGYTSALEGRARLAIYRNDVAMAIEALTSLASLIPADDLETLADLREQLGALHLKEGNLEQARKYFEGTLAVDDQRINVIQTLITICERLEEYKEVVDLLNRLVCLSADPLIRASLLFHSAEILGGKIGDEASAIDNLLKAYDLAPDYPPTLWRLIDYYWVRDDLESVMEMTEHLIGSLEGGEEEIDTRLVRMTTAILLVKDAPTDAAAMLRIALSHKKLLEPAVVDLSHAAAIHDAAEKIATMIRSADPERALYRVAEQLYQERPSTPGLTDLLVSLNEIESDS